MISGVQALQEVPTCDMKRPRITLACPQFLYQALPLSVSTGYADFFDQCFPFLLLLLWVTSS